MLIKNSMFRPHERIFLYSAIIVCIFLYSAVSLISFLDLGLRFLEWQVIFIFVVAAILSVFERGLTVFKVYVLTTFLFGFSIPIFSALGIIDRPPDNMYLSSDGVQIPIPDAVLTETYNVASKGLLGATIGYLFAQVIFNKKGDSSFKYKMIETSAPAHVSSILRLLFTIYLLVWAICVTRQVLLIFYSLEYGYVALIHKKEIVIPYALFFNIVDALYLSLSTLVLYYCKLLRPVYFTKMLLLFVVPYILEAFTGARGMSVLIIFVILTLLRYHHNVLFKISTLILSFLSAFLLLSLIGMYRMDFNAFTLNSIGDSILEFLLLSLTAVGGSILILSYSIIMDVYMSNSIPFAFAYIQSMFEFSTNYTIDAIYYKNYLAQHLVYAIDTQRFFRGATFGTAMIAELYDLFLGSHIIISVFLGFMVFIGYFCVHNLFKSPMFLYFGFIYLVELYFSPRGSIFRIFNKELLLGVFIIFIFSLLISPKHTVHQHQK